MRITIIYDNVVSNPELIPDWGFACLAETKGYALLFDTGAKSTILLQNMQKLGIDPLRKSYPARYLAAGAGRIQEF